MAPETQPRPWPGRFLWFADPEIRDRTWRILREIATLVDPSNASKFGVEMVGFEVQLSASAGTTGETSACPTRFAVVPAEAES